MSKIKLAIQKSGRLHESSLQLLRDCGMNINNGGSKLKSEAANFPLEVFFLRDDDIPEYVQDQVADIGIVGENVVLEKHKRIVIEEKLGFGKCRLSLAVKRADNYCDISFLQHKRIATSYPMILRKFLQDNNISADVHEISGSVEIAPGIGLADVICDLVSSGSTLLTNGLKEVQTILHSQAVLVKYPDLDIEKTNLLEKILFRIRAVNKASNNKYILLNSPNEKLEEIISLLPGMKSPTVLPLADKEWSSIHSVIDENDFWDIIEKLKKAGAQGILVVPIEKMII
jgi:ATP phosphoribosyltransferase